MSQKNDTTNNQNYPNIDRVKTETKQTFERLLDDVYNPKPKVWLTALSVIVLLVTIVVVLYFIV